jgi:hypothetical protein
MEVEVKPGVAADAEELRLVLDGVSVTAFGMVMTLEVLQLRKKSNMGSGERK